MICNSIYSQRVIQEFEMNEGGHFTSNRELIRSKIDNLNAMLTECMDRRSFCENIDLVSFGTTFQRLYEYIDRYVKRLQRRLVPDQNQVEGTMKQIKVKTHRNLEVLIENGDDFIRDYALFTRQSSGSRGCILLKVQNLNFVRWIYGAPTAQSVLVLMEKQLTEMCKETSMRIRVYAKDPEKGQFVVLCPPKTHFLSFEAFCFQMTRIRYNIPKFWSPIEYRLVEPIDCGKINNEEQQRQDRSPSMMIEGKSGMNKKENRRSLIRSLSKIIKPKHVHNVAVKSRSNASSGHLAVEQLMFEENDDAASVSFLEPNGNDENFNVLNRKKKAYSPKQYRYRDDKEAKYKAKCKALRTVFVTVAGAYNEGSGCMEYYERCEEVQYRLEEGLQKRNNMGSAYPLQMEEAFDPNKICVVKKYNTGSL